MLVLIISSMQDLHARAVMAALASQKHTAVEMLDLADFPSRLALSISFQGSKRRLTLKRRGASHIDLSEVGSVWWRRPQPFCFPASMTDPAHIRFAQSEAGTAFQGLYQCMDALWVNDPLRDAAATHKPWQLYQAQQVGLEIPPTLMTNDPEHASRFWDEHGGDVIYKQFLALPETWRETRQLWPEEKRLSETIRLTPVIFQRHVEAVADIRVTVIGRDFYTASADIQTSEYPADVRLNTNVRYRPYSLPLDLEVSLCKLMDKMQLEYGSIDLRLTPDGRHVFLEINPAGQFLYVEGMTGQKITAALAARLATGKLANVSRNYENGDRASSESTQRALSAG